MCVRMTMAWRVIRNAGGCIGSFHVRPHSLRTMPRVKLYSELKKQ